MEKISLWGKNIEKDFVRASENQLDDFLELIQYIQKNGISNKICERTLEKSELLDWLGSKDQIELNDIKRELSRYIEKANYCDEKKYEMLWTKIGKQFAAKILVLSFAKENIYYISTIAEYYTALRT